MHEPLHPLASGCEFLEMCIKTHPPPRTEALSCASLFSITSCDLSSLQLPCRAMPQLPDWKEAFLGSYFWLDLFLKLLWIRWWQRRRVRKYQCLPVRRSCVVRHIAPGEFTSLKAHLQRDRNPRISFLTECFHLSWSTEQLLLLGFADHLAGTCELLWKCRCTLSSGGWKLASWI